jgi:hypothetical protein
MLSLGLDDQIDPGWLSLKSFKTYICLVIVTQSDDIKRRLLE